MQYSDAPLDPARVRLDFPLLSGPDGVKRVVFLDSAASSQKPRQVLEAMDYAYRNTYANVHRGIYRLSEEATELYERARGKVASFLNAPSPDTIVFTRNATEALNLLAYSYGRHFLAAGDEIVLTEGEHHANFVPWLVLAKERGVVLRFLRIQPDGAPDMQHLEALLSPRTRLVTFAHISNVLGTINDARGIVARAHAAGAKVIIDGAQSVAHLAVDVAELDCDFFVCSSHKMFGPTGIGVLYGKEALLRDMPPFLTGGDMITEVTFEGATWAAPPYRFEAGTPPFIEAIGLGVAVDYLRDLGLDRVRAHDERLITYALDRLSEVPGLHVVGTLDPARRSGLVTFRTDGLHPHDLASILDENGIAVRAGLHCAHPLHQRLGLDGTTRASFSVYNDTADVDALIDGIYKAKTFFRR